MKNSREGRKPQTNKQTSVQKDPITFIERGGEGWCLVIEDRTLNLYLLDLLNDRKYTADFKWGVWKCTHVHIL